MTDRVEKKMSNQQTLLGTSDSTEDAEAQKAALFLFTIEEQEALKKYKYCGQDNGIVYNYFFSPLCNRLVKFCPYWLAPNIITLTGFMFTLAATLTLFICFGTEFEGKVDSWWCYFTAFCFFMSRLMDELDGKQARRTGNSSVLGMLMDHGVDSYAALLLQFKILKLMQFGYSWHTFVFIVWSEFTFFCTILNEYYTGKFTLAEISGPGEGSILVMVMLIATGILGNDWWAQDYTPFEGHTMTHAQWALSAIFCVVVIDSSTNIIKILLEGR